MCSGRKQWKDLQSIATARHEYYDHYNEIRETLPKVVGTLPDKVEDPVLIEIFGMHHHYFERPEEPIRRRDQMSRASRRRPARSAGEARVMVSATELFDPRGGRDPRVRGDVAELDAGVRASSPACVCDGGGSLTHAAIVEPRVRHPVRGRLLGGAPRGSAPAT